jgi:hypothetical protein
MFSPKEMCSDNHRDNNNEMLQSDDNCGRSFAPQASAVVCASKRKQQFDLRKCKSDSNVDRRHSKIDMGSTLSRSKSCDNIETDSIVYKSLTKNRKVDEKSLCSFDESEDDYKLLESSENDDDSDSGEDDSGCITKTVLNRNGHDTTQNSSSFMNNHNSDCIQQTPRAGNEIEIEIKNENDDLLCKKYSSTLPRVKHEKGIVDRDRFSRCSMPYKSSDNRAHCSKEVIMSDFEVVSDGKSEAAEVSKTLEAPIKGDKANDVTSSPLPSFRSTTLPKTRSRLSEPYSRHSLRHAIDLTMPMKHFGVSDASEGNAAIVPGNNGNELITMGLVGEGRKNVLMLFEEIC